MAEFADELGLSHAAVSRYESGKRQHEPEDSAIAKYLGVATTDQAQELLAVLGVNVEQLRSDILAGYGIVNATITYERSFDGSETWEIVNRETVKGELGYWYTDGGDRIMEEMETSARACTPDPSKKFFTPQAAYRATVTVAGAGGGNGKEGKETGK